MRHAPTVWIRSWWHDALLRQALHLKASPLRADCVVSTVSKTKPYEREGNLVIAQQCQADQRKDLTGIARVECFCRTAWL